MRRYAYFLTFNEFELTPQQTYKTSYTVMLQQTLPTSKGYILIQFEISNFFLDSLNLLSDLLKLKGRNSSATENNTIEIQIMPMFLKVIFKSINILLCIKIS